MEKPIPDLRATIGDIEATLGNAQGALALWLVDADPYGLESAAWDLELAYLKLVVLLEAVDLPRFHAQVLSVLEAAKKDGFSKTEATSDGEDKYLKWAAPLRQFLAALSSTFCLSSERTVTRDLLGILRACTYSIMDESVFSSSPSREDDVHRRIEAVLRCVFPDLRHKPRLTKPIKNFEPDTGLPSLRTLVEYKFLTDPSEVGRITDELLADTRGYTSKDWDSFLYVIYETSRIKPESEWKQLLRDCGVGSNTDVVVIMGHPVAAPRKMRRKRKSDHRSEPAGKSAGALD